MCFVEGGRRSVTAQQASSNAGMTTSNAIISTGTGTSTNPQVLGSGGTSSDSSSDDE